MGKGTRSVLYVVAIVLFAWSLTLVHWPMGGRDIDDLREQLARSGASPAQTAKFEHLVQDYLAQDAAGRRAQVVMVLAGLVLMWVVAQDRKRPAPPPPPAPPAPRPSARAEYQLIGQQLTVHYTPATAPALVRAQCHVLSQVRKWPVPVVFTGDFPTERGSIHRIVFMADVPEDWASIVLDTHEGTFSRARTGQPRGELQRERS